MGSTDSDGPSRESACDRCGDPLTSDHWIRLIAAHRGAGARHYADTGRCICVDCVAALGMLEFSPTSTDEGREAGAPARGRLARVRSRLR